MTNPVQVRVEIAAEALAIRPGSVLLVDQAAARVAVGSGVTFVGRNAAQIAWLLRDIATAIETTELQTRGRYLTGSLPVPPATFDDVEAALGSLDVEAAVRGGKA